ncbi:hypothetical protein, partial [Pseudomonas sp. NPDC096950]|uniref:hypothetical protein n=1 Tax=Pseudomonas sp. NPDC096950 TaxID=3364485 RepID=UPI00383BC6DC
IQISESIWNFTKTRESGFLRFWLSKTFSQHRPLVGAGLLAKAVYQTNQCRPARRLREQALSHKDCDNRSSRAFPAPQGALEKQYRLSLLQVFAMRQ